ncbi:type II toxin-antitoxin system RelB/DinJ family antitoxin [Sphingomonas oryzagri]
MPAAEVVRARIDPQLKKDATAVLAEMGLSVSDAIRMMLVRVAAEHALPFEIRSPNKTTQDAMRAARAGEVEQFDSVAALMADLHEDRDDD